MLALFVALPAAAQRAARQRDSVAFAAGMRIPLHEGINPVDIAGDGRKGLIVVGRRENYNGHSFTAMTAYLNSDAAHWDLLTFWNDDTESLTESTSEGADCAVRDFRVLRPVPHGPITIIAARRDFGESVADSATVHFDVYEVRRNSSGLVGYPATYFLRIRSFDASRRYCDVNEAFARELGLGAEGLFGLRFR